MIEKFHNNSESMKASNKLKDTFKPDKRLDVNDTHNDSDSKHIFNPDKRIDINDVYSKESLDKSIRKCAGAYINDVKKASEFKSTLRDFNLDTKNWRLIPGDKIKEARIEYSNKKEELIKAWENKTGKEWPVYNKDIKDANGNIIRKAGMRYDLHHIRPLCMGGTNTVDNITPLDVRSHKEVHSKDSNYKKLESLLKEKQ